MSMAPLLALPGRIKTVLDRLTATRAANLDDLDATISSRAPSSTAVSNATLTNARIINLDNLDAPISNLVAAKYQSQLITSSTTWVKPTTMIGDTILLTAIGGGGSGCLGGGAGSCFGGNGGESVQRMPVGGITTDQTVTIGAGGAALTAAVNANGNPGGNTVFGSLTFSGGGGGVFNNTYTSKVGGSFGGTYQTTLTLPGTSQGGVFGAGLAHLLGAVGGPGGGGLILDASGTRGGETTAPLSNRHVGGLGYGAGGGAATSNTYDSGAGAPGAVLVEWWEEL